MGNQVSHCEEAAVVVEEVVELAEEVPEEEEIIEEEPRKAEIKLETAAIDPRFGTTNQARHCFVAYNEAHKCFKEKGEDDSACVKLARQYRSICPGEWVANWNEQRENGTWIGKY